MATLEHTLALILRQLEQATAAGNELLVIELSARKEAICAVLVALDTTWI